MQRTKPNRPWVLKLTLFLVLSALGGCWFAWDATVAYPARGWSDASYRLWVYIDTAQQSGRATMRDLDIEDPAAEYTRLRERAREQTPGALEAARLEWLRALAAVGALNADTVEEQLIDDPATETETDGPLQRLAELREIWAGENARNQPKPLASWDIKVQWLIALVCFAITLGIVLHMARTMSKRYGWEAEEKRLHLPGGASLTPADLEDVDKRLWHKFFVFLKVKDSHDALGGKEIRLDLYPHAGLEEWVLEMERTAFPDREEKEPAETPSDESE